MAGEAQQKFVAGDEQIGLAAGGEDQKLLVVGVAAARQRETRVRRGGVGVHDELAVAGDQRRLLRAVEPEGGIGADTFEFGEAVAVGETGTVPAGQGRQYRHGVRIGEMEHVDEDVGVENEAHQDRVRNGQNGGSPNHTL